MIPMMNTYDTIRTSLHFDKFVVGELLFVEYKCPIEQEAAGVWTPMDYFVHVLSGKKPGVLPMGPGRQKRDRHCFSKAPPSSTRISTTTSAFCLFRFG
jgi:hypothetical protein